VQGNRPPDAGHFGAVTGKRRGREQRLYRAARNCLQGGRSFKLPEAVPWAEAERMSSLALNDGNFNSERDVVKEEYRQRILANPYGEFSLAIDEKSFAAHPYKRPSIGNIAELDAAQLPEVKAFHSTFYRPDNATLIVVG